MGPESEGEDGREDGCGHDASSLREALKGNHRGRYGVAVTRLLFLSVVLLVGCGGSQPSEPPATTEPSAAVEEPPVEQPPIEQPPVDDGTGPAADSQDVREALASANQLGFDLYARMRGTPGNLVMSPASVHLALSMTYAGARGETASQMASVLHVGPTVDDLGAAYGAALRSWNSRSPATLRVANRIFADRSVPVEDSFVRLTGQRYGAPLERLDFVGAPDPSRLTINQWVEQRTEDRIADLLPRGSISPLTRMVLANAIYFKGTWQTQFAPSDTLPRRFQVDGRTEVDVPAMTLQGRFAWANHPDGVRVLEMPYAGGDLSMVFVLPAERTGAAALPAAEAQLSQASLSRWRSALQEVEVQVQIPRFRMEPPTARLSDHLEALGMPLAFDAQADFGGIATLPGGLYISEVYHKAFIEVNEEGTEAAAATAVVMVTRSARPRPEPPRFIADHPFLFLLMDRQTGAVLFLGRVSDPR